MIVLVLINALLVTAFLLMGFQGTLAIFFASAVAATCAGTIFYLLASGAFRVRLTWVLAGGLLFGYGAGTMNTMLSFAMSGEDGLAAMGIPKQYVAYAILLVLISCAALLAGGYLEPPLLRDRHIITMGWKQERFLWAVAALVALAYAHGDLGFAGVAYTAETYRSSIFGTLVQGFPNISVSLATIGILQTRGRRRIRFVVLAAFMLLAVFPMGRRAVLYCLALAAFAALRLSGWKLQLSAARKFLIAIVVVVLLALSSYGYMAVRVSLNSTQSAPDLENANGSLLDVLPVAIENMFTNQRGVQGEIAQNMKSRTFVIGYLALLARGGDTPSPLWGEDFYHAIELITPDLFYSVLGFDKAPVRQIGSEEELANEHFGLPVQDEANSILTAGIIDFGLPGVIAYPLLLCLGYRWVLHLLGLIVNAEGELFCILFTLWIFMLTENEINGYMASIRQMILSVSIWALLFSLPDFFGSSLHHLPVQESDVELNSPMAF